ncbi:glutathione S-transferase family protein [Calothrix sp. NIES-3974]|uniref:glutathione S-transferase family protein n=1 Tax=Calothrix sp. NIES-3974 TaxID=2005462 RepID=UPI000B603B7D|nr:glutathione S-transferase family protein [Calothrix sp. NIES-3974]BAZ05690.1 glutathione S-transferase-like protein [Calothrix sp. NIES-3974]
MLKFYYNPVSMNARRVWVTLLEKQIPFEAVLVKLDGDQFGDEFTAINPLQRVPVIVDHGLRVVESLAILDYLEAKYPTPSLIPHLAEEIATVRMVKMVTVGELQPALIPLTRKLVGLDVDAGKIDDARQRILTVMQFYENLLDGRTYFVNDQLTLGDIVAGTVVSSLPFMGFDLDSYPHLQGWLNQLEARESWQTTALKPAAIATAIPHIRAILARRF